MSSDVLALVGGNNQIYPVLIELESTYEGCINSKLHTTLKINLVRVKGENPSLCRILSTPPPTPFHSGCAQIHLKAPKIYKGPLEQPHQRPAFLFVINLLKCCWTALV